MQMHVTALNNGSAGRSVLAKDQLCDAHGLVTPGDGFFPIPHFTMPYAAVQEGNEGDA